VDESKPKIAQPEEQPEQPGEGVENENSDGDFTLEELLTSYRKIGQQAADVSRREEGV
jgi:hypothetical protein